MRPAQYVRALRAYLKMSQADLARLSGISQANIARVEAERKGVRLATIFRLLDAMECDMLVLPLPRRRLGDIVWERDPNKEKPGKPWVDPDLIPLANYRFSREERASGFP